MKTERKTETLSTDELLIAFNELPPHSNYHTYVALPLLGKVVVGVCMCDCNKETQGVMYEAIMVAGMGEAPAHAATATGFLLLIGRMGVEEGARWKATSEDDGSR